MTQPFGKLTLNLPDGLEQEFELGKPNVTLGRALTNDVVLPDARVSRDHARLEYTPAGCFIQDLGSANGTRVNGVEVRKIGLAPGDVISMGNSILRYELVTFDFEPEMTMIDSEAELNATLVQMPLEMALNDTSQPRLVIHTSEHTWEVTLENDALTIGRSNDNEIVINHEKVSRQHARIERRGESYWLRDLKSTNGTWVGERRIEDQTLQNGDSFRIGPAQIVFKTPIHAAELTLIDDSPGVKQPAHHPVVFVPGFMGSELWMGKERVWPNVRHLFKNPEVYRLPEGAPLEARGLLGEVVIVPNLIKLEQYNRLGDYLVEDLGYERGVDLLEFSYDWRRDVRLAARQLAEAIDQWKVSPPVTVIAHSLGTLVSRYYVERLGGKSKVGRLVLIGGPHQGVPKAATSLLLGPDLLPFGLMGERLRQVIATFPSSYQILPTYLCATDQNGQKFNILEDETWLSQEQRPLLRNAYEFRRELGARSSVPTVSIFGYGLKTITNLRMHRSLQGSWEKLNFDLTPGGDGTIPENSAVLSGSEIHPVQQYHGSLYVDKDVKMRLKLELMRQ